MTSVWGVGFTIAAALAGLVVWVASNVAARKSEERTRALELKVAEQQERAANAERTLLEIQERARPRSIDPDARTQILEALSIGPGSTGATVSIEFVSGSTDEPHQFAKAIWDILKEANWNLGVFDGGPAVGSPPKGLIIRISDIGGVDGTAAQLQHALGRGGFTAIISKTPTVKAGEVWLRVGLKP